MFISSTSLIVKPENLTRISSSLVLAPAKIYKAFSLSLRKLIEGRALNF